MLNVLFAGLIASGCIILVNLLLTLRLVQWLRSLENLHKQQKESETLPELAVNTSAPGFTAKTLAGKWTRLSDYAGRSVVLIFVSPHCGHCRQKMPELITLDMRAQEQAGVKFVLVSDSSATETYAWVESIRIEDKVEVTLPMLIAPRPSELLKAYNPRGLTPYYCFINGQGIVQARGPLGMGEWLRLQREWEGLQARSISHLFT